MGKNEEAKRYLIIHGHFYQPPRENPWTERIERQESAFPYHDWNERITRECYRPNTCSRILDPYGRITELINNYEWISFNFGPTLLRWLEDQHPDVYEKIIAADARSVERFEGHGNAIAQVYNHIIMPLASRRDQETQIRWGVKDFERRFNRSPEGIWLAETAINQQTLEILMDFGFRFIILSPHQAEAVRNINEKDWVDVSDGTINIGQPYRCYQPGRRGKKSRDRYIDIFFYHPQLAQDISFNHLLRNADALAERIALAFEETGGDLISIATDGEVYGHHEPFADMALAYLVTSAAASHGFSMANFGYYLDTHEVTAEVRLKPGPNGEGTAWSCFHGVGRWKEDCGCKIDPVRNWNQKWRTPLREGLNELRDSLGEIFERETSPLLKDPWKARDEYIEIIDGRERELVEGFLSRHARKKLSEEEKVRVLSLLESQRNSLLMFTSCGWFFDDISGIETVQIMLYAARAIELAGENHSTELEEKFLKTLGEAKSNVEALGTGAEIYRRAVSRTRIDAERIVAQHAIFAHLFGPAEALNIFGFSITPERNRVLSNNSTTLQAGLVKMVSPYTMKQTSHAYLLIVEEDLGFACFSKEVREESQYRELEDKLAEAFVSRENEGAAAARSFGRGFFDTEPVTLSDLFQEERELVAGSLASKRLSCVCSMLENIFDENKALLMLLRDSGVQPPRAILAPSEIVLTRRLTEEVEMWERSLEQSTLTGIKSVLQDAAMCGVEIDKEVASIPFSELIIEKLHTAVEEKSSEMIDSIFDFVELAASIDVKLDETAIQDVLYDSLNNSLEEISGSGGLTEKENREFFDSLLALAERLNFNTEKWRGEMPESSGG